MSHQICISFNFTMISEGLKGTVNSWLIHWSSWDDAEQNWVISQENHRSVFLSSLYLHLYTKPETHLPKIFADRRL